MDEKIIEINYPHGRINFSLDRGFPLVQKKLKILLKTIDEDWENRCNLLDRIEYYLDQRIKEKRKTDNAKTMKSLEANLREVKKWMSKK